MDVHRLVQEILRFSISFPVITISDSNDSVTFTKKGYGTLSQILVKKDYKELYVRSSSFVAGFKLHSLCLYMAEYTHY